MLQGYVYDDSFIADGAFSSFRTVVAGQDNDINGKHCKYPAGQDAKNIVGITQNATTASGDTVLVRRAGLTKLEVASGNVTYGMPLRIHDVEGRADQQTAAWVTGDGVIGYAEGASGASGDIIECWLTIQQVI